MRVAIVQSNYIPWKGYFDLIGSSDVFVLFDDVQYTRRDWRNRNQIKTPVGPSWLTVPVRSKGNFHQKICEIEIDNSEKWAVKHWRTIVANYSRAKNFDEVAALFEPLYCAHKFVFLSELNEAFIREICNYLGLTTRIKSSSEYPSSAHKTERLLEICKELGATQYVSGPSAKAYLDEAMFTKSNISVRWFSYEKYPTYTQLWGEFVHEVSILDLLFNHGRSSVRYMKLPV